MNGAERITAERERHVSQEGWTPQHDAQHDSGALLDAAVCYIANAHEYFEVDEGLWPWDKAWDKRDKHSDIRSLEIAGALIAAEIDRRLATRQETDQDG